MRRFLDVAGVVAWRSLRNWYSNPAFAVPSIIFPLFFFTAFAGGLSSVGNVPGFDYEPGYTTFQFGFVLMQSAAFGGVFTGFAVASDFENGFSRRLMLAAPNRLAILTGYAVAAMARALVIGGLLFVVGLIAGMNILGGAGDLAALVALVVIVASLTTLFACGFAFRLRTIQAGPAMQMPVFLILFLAPVYAPLDLIAGWVHTVATVNPATALLDAARALLAGTPVKTGVVLGVLAGLGALLAVWSVRGLRKAEAAG